MNRAGLAISALVLCSACEAGSGGQQVNLERMLEQPRYDLYEESAVFADGKVLQAPPTGTVARGAVIAPTAFADGLADEEPIAQIPVRVTADLIALGQSRYRIFCAACHGGGGYGGSPVALNMDAPVPPSFRTTRMRSTPPGTIYQYIVHGKGRMPSYAAELSAIERWAVVAYMTAMLQSPPTGLEQLTDSIRATRWPRPSTSDTLP